MCNWDRADVQAQASPAGFPDGYSVECPRCGEYLVESLSPRHRKKDGHLFISCAARQSWESGERLLIKPENASALILAHRNTVVTENLNRLLRYLGKKSRRPSAPVEVFFERDFTVIDVDNTADFVIYLRWLADDNLINFHHVPENTSYNVTLLREGWKQLQLGHQPGGTPGTCFVAMWFDAGLTEAYEPGLLQAIETDCGFKALRIDRKEHNNQITDEIMAGIRGAQFMVADFTGHRAGVYYEAGFARGLGREVIYCCHEDSFKERHFDTSVINHVTWRNFADLRKKLADRIKATILPKA